MKSLESESPPGGNATNPPMSLLSEYFPDEAPPVPPRFDLPPIKLETRGVTPQKDQREFWHSNTIFKFAVAAKLREAGRFETAKTLEECHTRYSVGICRGCGKHEHYPNRCDNFFCAECQPRLSSDRRRAVEWWTREVKQPKHVVLTTKNTLDIKKSHIQELRGWFTALRRSRFARGWRGGFYSIEVTNEGAGWHLHLHAIVDANWIDSIQLSTQWARITNQVGKIVKVKDARAKDYLAEVTKYAVKGSELAKWSGTKICEFLDAFTGVRTFGVFGTLYGARTRFHDWWKQVRSLTHRCACGCAEFIYFSESQFLKWDLVPTPLESALPPPVATINHPELHLA